ncbi:MAG: hypothetical protein M3R61_00220 [Chloroflexota bacterium]|nr:hypothetical protein [Chloroflexota bacterium]
MALSLAMNIYERGASGVPTTTYVTDLASRADSYTHTISDRFGFESCRIVFAATPDEALDWLQTGLMRSLIVSGPDAEVCWEGFLETVTVTIGQKKASLSLKNMANNVKMLWTALQGTPGDTNSTPTSTSLVSQALYGKKDYLGTLPKVDGPLVIAALAKTLAALSLPRSSEPSSATTGALGDVTVELTFAGWYATLDWSLVSNASTVNSVTNTQLTGIWLPSFASINAFLRTDYADIRFAGPVMPEYVAHYSTYKQVVERMLSVGDSSNRALTYGVYEDRRFGAVVSAAATPTIVTYQEDAASGQILDANGAIVQAWNVRPNAMSEVVQLLDVGPVTGAVDAAARKYVGRVTCQISGDRISCTLEPSGAGGLDALLAAFPQAYFWNS